MESFAQLTHGNPSETVDETLIINGNFSEKIGALKLNTHIGSWLIENGTENKLYFNFADFSNGTLSNSNFGTNKMTLSSAGDLEVSGGLTIGTPGLQNPQHTSTDGNVKIVSNNDAKLIIVADTDNSGETDNPLIELSQDG
jgi:hypothetical protein